MPDAVSEIKRIHEEQSRAPEMVYAKGDAPWNMDGHDTLIRFG